MRDRHLQALAGLVLLGAALRFATLDGQSYWLDEAATVELVRMGFGDMVDGIPGSESTPPLYYVAAWAWAQLFGSGEIGLRSLSALTGAAVIPVAWSLGGWVAGRRAAVAAGALAATSPFLVWYSQEARAYSLLVLLSGLAVLFLVRGRTWAWAAASALALATHYFALFPVAGMAAWLLWRRRAFAPVALVAAAGAALLPLALDQRSNDNAHFIEESSLLRRLAQAPKQFLTGYDAPAEAVVTVAALALAAVAALGVRRLDPDARARAAAIAAVGGAALLVPASLAVAGADFFIARNVLPALLPLLVVIAAGAPAAVTAALACLGTALAIAVAAEPSYQRDDWRGAAESLPAQERNRAVIVTPASGIRPLRLYLPRSKPMPERGHPVTEFAIVALPTQGPGGSEPPPRPRVIAAPAPLYGQVARVDGDTFTTALFRGADEIHAGPTVGASPIDGKPARVLFQELPAR